MIIEDNFSYFSLKPYVVIPHLNCLEMPVQRGVVTTYVFMQNLQTSSLIIIKYSLLYRALVSSSVLSIHVFVTDSVQI